MWKRWRGVATRMAVMGIGAFALGEGSVWAGQPNVVIFLADDAGWGDYGHSGNLTAETPRIDSIAKEGASFDRFYVCPVCAPTRAEFLTGRYHLRGGVTGVSTGQERLDLDEKTIADAFRGAGYATGAFGKWHNGTQYPYHPRGRGFEEYLGHTAGHWGEYFDAPLDDNGKMVRSQGYIVDACTSRALDFIERHREKPFFCYIPFTTPHSPWAVPAEYWERFRAKDVAQGATRPELEKADETRCALAMLANQDWNVGRVLDELDALGLGDDTIIFYFSDNGPNSWRWNGGMKGRKGQTDEGGVRSVGYLRWRAKLPQGRVVSQIAGAIDLLPTLVSLAGIKRVGDAPLDGLDLSPLLAGDAPEWPDRFIVSAWNGRTSLRTQTHRLDQDGNLYDMIGDPGQTAPINDGAPDLAGRLASALKGWRLEMYGPEASGHRPEKKAARNAVDPRPLPVGYPEFPITDLPARDGEPRGTVARSSSAPNCSYFVNWTSLEDRLVWNVEVVTAGRYEVTVDYTVPEADVGAVIELSLGDSARLSGPVRPAWDPPLNTNQDTLPRPPAESQMKPFKTLRLGEITLPKGRGPLVLRATSIPGKSVMDLRRITLRLLNGTSG